MSFNDFFLNFDSLYLCRFFGNEWKEVFFESQWSKASQTAGGCTNYDTVGLNPQMKLTVNAKSSSRPVEVFIELNVQGVSSQEDSKSGIGFEIFDLEGKKVTDRRVPKPLYSCPYRVANAVTFEGEFKSTSKPLTLLISTFKPDIEAKFRFTVHYKHEMGSVKLENF